MKIKVKLLRPFFQMLFYAFCFVDVFTGVGDFGVSKHFWTQIPTGSSNFPKTSLNTVVISPTVA